MDPIENLKKLGFELPEPSTPGGSYVSVNIRKDIAYIAIQFPILNEAYKYQGRLGDDISTKDGFKAMDYVAPNEQWNTMWAFMPRQMLQLAYRPGSTSLITEPARPETTVSRNSSETEP